MRQFFQVPTRVHNALMILCFISKSNSKSPIPLSLISKYLKLSYEYLEHIVVPLKKAGLIKSFRGSNGGYKLDKELKDISLADIIVALEGPIKVADCSTGGGCAVIDRCPSIKIWKKLQIELNNTFKKIKLTDV